MDKVLNTRSRWTLLMLGLCLLPSLLAALGLDWSSVAHTLPADSLGRDIQTDELFYVLAGAMHHALLEWTAVSFALVTGLLSLLHYRVHRDLTVPIIGLAVLSAGLMDAFHTLAATRVIEARADNTDFIPFTWALSRIFNAAVMIAAAAVSIWLSRDEGRMKLLLDEGDPRRHLAVLLIIGVSFLGIAYAVVHSAAVTQQLPQTMFPDAFVSRPFDVLPLALFVLAATFYWIWYRQHNTVVRFAIALSMLPEIATQLHMAFGSASLFDHHFNAAHSLKILAYATIMLGLLLDLLKYSADQRVQTVDDDLAPNTLLFHVETEELEVGRASRPLGVLLPIAAFLLALTVALFVSFTFYIESERLIRKNSVEKLRIESELVEPLMEQLYRQSASDVLFLSQTPPIEGLIDAKEKGEEFEYELWSDSLTIIFSEMLNSKSDYFRISYVGVADRGRELVSVVRNIGGVHSVPDTLLQTEQGKSYFQSSLQTQPGAVAISSVTLKRINGEIALPHQSVIRVSTPIYDPETGKLFGIIIIHVDFGRFMANLVDNQLSGFKLYLANYRGDYIYHPDANKRFAQELGRDSYLQKEFPALSPVINERIDEQGFSDLENIGGQVSASYFLFIHLSKYGGNEPLMLLLQHEGDSLTQELVAFRNRSVLLGISLALVALALAVLFSRRVAHPLTKMTEAVQHYERSGELEALPTDSTDEIGVLARSFHNLMQRMNAAMNDQQRMSATYQEASDRLQAIVDSAVDAIITIDAHGRVQSFNPSAVEIFGYQEAEVVGQNVKLLMPQEYADQHDQYLNDHLAEGKSKIIGVGRELVAKHKDGSEFPIHLAISETKLDNGVIYTGIIRDITSQKAAERALIESKEAAENAARYKSEFLASMSHEIRTPMNGVLGMLGLLMRSDLSKEQFHYAELARSSADSLLTIINDILDFSKVEAGRLELEILDFNLNSQLGEFAESISPKAQEKGLELILDVVAVDRSMVRGDPGRIRQILSNLVGNAIKFTETGEVTIRAELQEKPDGKLRFICAVSDTGIGIPADKVKGLFDSFTQVDASTTRKYGGTGLGLAIVNQLCELMHGSVTVSSTENIGSCFSFEVELEPSDQAQQIMPSVDIRGSHMLVVDDNSTNRAVLRGQLESWGAIVSEAEGAQMALSLMAERAEANSESLPVFTVAFLDMQMPDIDGMQLGSQIRADKRFDDTKLVMMTSMARRGDAQRFADLGFSAYFPKPTTTSDLFDALQVVMAGGEALELADPLVTQHYLKSFSPVEKIEPEHKRWSKSTRLLLVEDNHINQAVALGALEDFGLHSDVAGNGIEALIAIREAEATAPYHLVLMDCQMPDMDGYEATRQIREGVAGEHAIDLPVIAMTANAMIGDREKCLEAGMSDYLSKPIDNDALELMLEKWLPEELVLTENSSQESSPQQQGIEQSLSDVDSDVWDQKGALKRVRGKEERLIYLVEMFVNDMPRRMQELQTALQDQELQVVVEQAHAVKGISANLGALKLTDIAGAIEQLGRDQDVKGVQQLGDSLNQHYDEIHLRFTDYLSRAG